MAAIIDPARHVDLIAAQVAQLDAFDALHDPKVKEEDRPALREAVRQAGDAREAALQESGLVAEHGHYTASQALIAAGKARRAQRGAPPSSEG